MKILSTAILLLFFSLTIQAQDGMFEKMYVTPSISLGYTFGGLFNIGVDLDLTTSVTKDLSKLKNAGLSISYYIVLMKGGKSPHQIAALHLMFENEQMDLKGGYALLNYKWGLRKVNDGSIGAFSLDVSFTNREKGIPWLGIKSVVYNQREWIWFDIPYFSLYGKQKFYLRRGNL